MPAGEWQQEADLLLFRHSHIAEQGLNDRLAEFIRLRVLISLGGLFHLGQEVLAYFVEGNLEILEVVVDRTD